MASLCPNFVYFTPMTSCNFSTGERIFLFEDIGYLALHFKKQVTFFCHVLLSFFFFTILNLLFLTFLMFNMLAISLHFLRFWRCFIYFLTLCDNFWIFLTLCDNFLQLIKSFLKNGGRIIITCPNFKICDKFGTDMCNKFGAKFCNKFWAELYF